VREAPAIAATGQAKAFHGEWSPRAFGRRPDQRRKDGNICDRSVPAGCQRWPDKRVQPVLPGQAGPWGCLAGSAPDAAEPSGGIARWTGALLHQVLDQARPAADGVEVRFAGADHGSYLLHPVLRNIDASDLTFVRSLTLADANDPDAEILIAYEMNGEPLNPRRPRWAGTPCAPARPMQRGTCNPRSPPGTASAMATTPSRCAMSTSADPAEISFVWGEASTVRFVHAQWQ